MSGQREIAVEALFTALKTGATFNTASRRNRDPEGLAPAETPALFLIESVDGWERRQGYNILAKREMKLVAIIYYAVDPSDNDTIPSTFINNAIDAFEGLMKPDNPVTETFTLGGLVQACLIDGESRRAPGDITGKALAVVPIRILFP